ncbi:hypothetical protein Sjap_007211 [Stephania japonica]|uniref:Uncharacterized protein n=1 Tax=Stephania japonica TaxID=461633 RepID=A0AAP0JMA8_9MAGN
MDEGEEWKGRSNKKTKKKGNKTKKEEEEEGEGEGEGHRHQQLPKQAALTSADQTDRSEGDSQQQG